MAKEQPVALFWDKAYGAHMTVCRSGFGAWVRFWLLCVVFAKQRQYFLLESKLCFDVCGLSHVVLLLFFLSSVDYNNCVTEGL